METLPSKELLSEVLRVNVKFIEFDIETIKRIIHGSARDNDIYYHDGKWKFINIYELVFKNCMDWAYSKGYDICLKELDGKYYLLTEEQMLGHRVGDGFVISDSFQPFNSRIEAILKGCEWIMEQKR